MVNFLINWAGLLTFVIVVYALWTTLNIARLSFIYTYRWSKFVKLRDGYSRPSTDCIDYFFEEFRNITSDWFRGVKRVA